MHTWLPVLLLATSMSSTSAEPPIHRIDVHVMGALATVEVWHTLDTSQRATREPTTGAFVDLALPAGAAVLDWELLDGRQRTHLAADSEVKVHAALLAALKLRHLIPPKVPNEDGADYRIHITPLAEPRPVTLHYRYVVPVACLSGKLALRMPESEEENPTPPQVSVVIEALPDRETLVEASLANQPATLRPGARRVVMQGTAPARAAWDIVWRYQHPTGTFDGQVLASAARIKKQVLVHGHARNLPEYAVQALVCRADSLGRSEPPSRVFLLIDRSRSVGQGGMSAERALVRGLMEALPPSVKINAVLFAGDSEPVFALPRLATKEAMDLVEHAADPNRLDNGTDVSGALTRIRKLADPGGATSPTWVVIVTDGALPADQTAGRMQAALSGLNDRGLRILVLFVRQPGDDPVSANAIASFAQVVAGHGGLVRVAAAGTPRDSAHEILLAMAKGGDLLDVEIGKSRLADVVAPGQGASIALTEPAGLPSDKRLSFSAHGLSGAVQAQVRPSMVSREWLDALLARRRDARPTAWAGAGTGVAVAILPNARPTPNDADQVSRGRMDPVVLRNALALAFMPRARACYLSRRVAKAGDVRLQGRIKLELTIDRGELHDAVVRSSTLDNPEVEDCVRKAAWAVNYPRPEHRDAPTVANLNLVFRPHTPAEAPPDASPLDREIELILGPLAFPTDFKDLLEESRPDNSSPP
jgi:hypothetical protein